MDDFSDHLAEKYYYSAAATRCMLSANDDIEV